MVHYKLIYFNARGAAELSRLLFKVKGVEFEDVRISVEDWPELKPSRLLWFQITGLNKTMHKVGLSGMCHSAKILDNHTTKVAKFIHMAIF